MPRKAISTQKQPKMLFTLFLLQRMLSNIIYLLKIWSFVRLLFENFV